jgi:superfamily I DNA and/or RNA helicase
VVRYVEVLLKGARSREPVQQKDIGIVAPYIRQVYKLKAKLKHKTWEDIEVGTTEAFQGREKRVIIVSTVRSYRDLLDLDIRLKLGFVANAKVCFHYNSYMTEILFILLHLRFPSFLYNG